MFAPHADLLSFRREFPQFESGIYLNNCSAGALSERVCRALGDFMEIWRRFGGRSRYADGGWLETIELARHRFARLIGASPHEIALAPNASTALGVLASAIDHHHRDGIVTTQLDFPTVPHQWLAKAGSGVRCEIIADRGGVDVDLDLIAHAVTERTALVATSRIFFASGYIQDVAEIARIAHRSGARILIDDYQATGLVPIDVKQLDVDFLITGTQKWLLGGPGLAFLYVREELHDLIPTVAGWFGHKRQLEFIVDSFEPHSDARKYELGTPAIGAVYAACAGLEMILEAQPQRIFERTRFLSDRLLDRLKSSGPTVKAIDDQKHRSSIVMAKSARAKQAVEDLAASGIVVDER
ncbi:MAG TPA: aminotransferase class V-fold PLP-dependent enzyme, partial [Candidatus Binataceae bacterium]|nr:aminotransferase class V-fold PLP-dependent enzyme [Candidatus Binataceae bacterium]